MRWQEALEQTGSGNYAKLKDDGDSVVFKIVGEPKVEHIVFIEGKPEAFDPSKHDGRPSTRFSLDIMTQAGDAQELALNAPTMRALANLFASHPMNGTTFEITRRGAAGSRSTKYEVRAITEQDGDAPF